ncbi:MAG: hypothetical protein ABII82_13395, partial [Verrucomicrobiota bacterium]
RPEGAAVLLCRPAGAPGGAGWPEARRLVVTFGAESWWTLAEAVEGTGAAVVAVLPGNRPGMHGWPEAAGAELLRAARRVAVVTKHGERTDAGRTAGERLFASVRLALVAALASEAEADARLCGSLLPKDPASYGPTKVAAHLAAEGVWT